MKDKFNSQFFSKILDGINSNIRIINIETNEIVYMNDCCKKTFHVEAPEGHICWNVLQKDMKQRCEFCKIEQLKQLGEGKSYFWEEHNTKTGRVYLHEDSLEKVDGVRYLVQSSIDITEYVKLCEEVTTDELTGVLNRKAGKEKLDGILKNMKTDEKFTAVLYDIDGLKWVNDTYGHLEGDRLLTYVAQKIQKALSEPDFVFRLSGDEFIIIFMNQDADMADRWMKKILKELKEGRESVGIHYDVTFSYGVAMIQEREKLTVSDVLSIVDTQMYIQKRDYHIVKGQKRIEERHQIVEAATPFHYNKEYLFDVLDKSIDDYVFAGNLKTGEFKYSYKMMIEFGLPSQVLENAAEFWAERIHPDDAKMFLRSNQEIADGRLDRHTIVYRAKNAKGEWIHLMCRGQMVRDTQGKPDLFGGIIRNMDKKESDINEELRIISDSSSDGIFKAAMTEGFPVLYANDGYYELHGYTKKQMAEELGNHADTLVHERDRERINQQIADGLAQQKRRIVLEYRIHKRDGSIAWVHVNAGFVPDADGTVMMIGMVMDITERRQLEERLTRTEQLFKAASKNSRLNMWELDIRAKRIIQTEESQSVHGYGMTVENVPEILIETGYFHPDDVEAVRKFYRELGDENAPKSITTRVKTKQRKDYWWEKVTYTIVRKLDGKPVWAIGTSEDVTTQKEAEIRVFEEERMRELLSEDMICSFQMNLSRNHLEKFWDYVEGRECAELLDEGYEGVYNWILSTIANEDDKKRFQQQYSPKKMNAAALQEKKNLDFEFQQKQKNGLILWTILNIRVAVSPESGELFLFGHLKNIDLIKRRELSLRQKVEIDELSGFYNFTTAKLLIEETLVKAPKNSCALIILDVDNFKEINQKGGFLSGDRLLKIISNELAQNIPFASIKARTNGDMFLVFCYNLDSQNHIRDYIERIRQNISRKYNVEGNEFEVTVSGGMSFSFTDGMSYEQMYQCASHALNVAKREGKNKLLMYREIEKMDTGMDIEITVDPDTCKIIDMNATGRIAFGITALNNSNVTCHELLYNDIEPCPFCYKKMSLNEEQVWKCFVPRLNKVMYVQVKYLIKDGRKVKRIHLREKYTKKQGVESMTVLNLLKDSWRRIERGENRTAVILTFMNYIAGVFEANYVALYEKQKYDKELRFEQSWKQDDLAEPDYSDRKIEDLKKIFLTVSPRNILVIHDKESVGYKQAEAYYGAGKVPLPVILAGSYEKENLVSLLVLEHAKERKDSLRTLEMIADFMHQTMRIFELHQKYEYAVQYDQKTGILNYQSYMRCLEQVNEDKYSTFGIWGIHIADLKNYNKIYGMKAGDKLLKQAADILVKSFGKDFVFRVSGARLMVLCPNITYENFQQRCEGAKDQLEKVQTGMFAEARVWGEQVISIEKLEQQIEEKLQIALTKIRMTRLEDGGRTVADLLTGLKESIANSEFCTFLQPKANVQTGEICGAEALIRYRDKEKGIIPPGRFLPQIERAGFIRLIDLFVLKDVCRILKKWLENGLNPIPISLNYSRATILEPDILEETNQIVESIGVPKELIQIEVTETISSTDNSSLKEIVQRFVEAGYKIALDDFGAEYSNIYVLYSLNLSTLKLDRQIVSDIYHDKRARMVVENVIDICKKLQIECVAEGVETEEHLGVLKEMSCDVIQGYFLNKPLPEDEFERQYIKKNRH